MERQDQDPPSPANHTANRPPLPGGQGRPGPRLLEQVRDVMRLGHYSIHTERSYVDWIKGLTGEEARQVIVGMSSTPQVVAKLETWRSSGAWLNSGAVLAINMALLPELEAPSAAWGF